MLLLRDLKIFNDGSVEVVPVVDPPQTGRREVFPHRLAIIKQGEYWLIPDGRSDPQTQAAQDNPIGISKGHTIQFDDSWFSYAKKIMTDSAYSWWSTPFTQVFNRHHRLDGCNPRNNDGDTDEPRAENMIMPGNILALDKFTQTHARIICRDSMQAPVNLNPLVDNWKTKPTEWMMSTMVDNNGVVRLVGSGRYVFTPVVKRLAERWCALIHIELFPPLPFDVTYDGSLEHVTGYCIEGTDVWGHAETRDIPLRLVGQDRVPVHPCDGWSLSSKPVIPLPT